MINKDEIKFREEILKMSSQLKKFHPNMKKITKEYLDKIPSKNLHDIAENIHLSIKGYKSQKAGKRTIKRGKKRRKNMTRKMRGGQWDVFLTAIAVISGVSIVLSNMGVELPEPLESIFGRRPIGNRNPRPETIEHTIGAFAEGSSSFRRRRTSFDTRSNRQNPSRVDQGMRKWSSRAREQVEVGDDTCGICLDKLSRSGRLKKGSRRCSHKFHKQCIDEWHTRSRTCPLCRQ